MENGNFIAVIPAAGRSRRMGDHKLMLPWHDNRVIDKVLNAWTSSRVSRTLMIVRKQDKLLRDACRSWPVTVLPLEFETSDMKASIQQGLSYIENYWAPSAKDYCLIAPADLPRLTAHVINIVIDASVGSKRIVAPYFGDRRGHPVAFPWKITKAIFDLLPDEGLDALIERSDVKQLLLDSKWRIQDIDTPADYQREKQDSKYDRNN